jgi:RNA polymerase sigma factor (sigma-70 family)
MTTLAHPHTMTAEQNVRIAQAVAAQQARLRRFIRRQVVDPSEAADILQDVFYELVVAYRLMKPIEQLGAWLLRVAKNRITDRFRRRQTEAIADQGLTDKDGELSRWEDLLPSEEDGPEEAFAQRVLLEQIEAAIADLPPAQRDVFIAHELEGRSFKRLSFESGVSVNTLLSRKHAAVNAVRERLLAIYNEF